MKIIKKIAAIMLSVMMVLGMCSVVGAVETSGTSETDKGKITIDNAIVDQTYTIYRILELESFSDKTTTKPNTGNYAYKAVKEWENFIKTGEGKDYLEIEDGYVYWKGDNSDARAAVFAKKALDYAKDSKNNITASLKPVTAKSTTVTFENLPLGYYLVDSSTGALCSLNTTDTDVTIKEKNAAPTVEKKVQEDSKINQPDEYGKSNTADIGQTVNFQTTITAQAGAQNYVLHDKMDAGLTFDKNSVTVQKNGTEVGVSNYTLKVKDTSSSITDDCTFEIVFTQEFCDALNANDTIIVTYSATLNENAVIGEKGNTNEAKLEYGDKNTISSTTTTKTYKIPVFKYTKKNGINKELPGAIFTLSKSENGGDPIKLVATEPANTYRVAKKTEAEGITKITNVTTPENGSFTIIGLDADTYFLTEIQQPDGYNKLSAPVKIVIKEDGTITIGDAKDTVDKVEVENKSGSILPSTGGMGTTLFYIFGAILVIGSGVVLITKKRMK